MRTQRVNRVVDPDERPVASHRQLMRCCRYGLPAACPAQNKLVPEESTRLISEDSSGVIADTTKKGEVTK